MDLSLPFTRDFFMMLVFKYSHQNVVAALRTICAKYLHLLANLRCQYSRFVCWFFEYFKQRLTGECDNNRSYNCDLVFFVQSFFISQIVHII